MVPFRCRLFALALGCAVLSNDAAAGAWRIPPIDGELSGEFTALKLEGAPKLRWRMMSRTDATGGRKLEVTIEGEGARLVARGVLDAQGAGTWRIDDGEVDAARWFSAAARHVGEMGEGLAVAGRVNVSGRGEIDAGALRGALRVEWTEGNVRNEVQEWTLDGVTFSGEFGFDLAAGTFESVQPFRLAVATITTPRFGARALAIGARLNADGTLSLEEAKIEIAGGEMMADPGTVTLSPLATELNLRLTNVGLQDVAALVPSGLLESRGRINGAVRLGWSEENGFKLGEGNLVLEQTEPALVRLAPAPGFLTAQLTEKLPLLPDAFGALARWTSLENPAYDEIRDIELGRTGLQITSLSVQLSPEGDREGRTARVRLTGKPARPDSVVGAVTFEVNVAGPLSEVLRLGLNQNFSVETR